MIQPQVFFQTYNRVKPTKPLECQIRYQTFERIDNNFENITVQILIK
jgi:hypothetical protein